MQRLPRFLGTKVSKPKGYNHLEQLKSVAIVATDFLFPFLRGKKILLEEFKEISVGEHVCVWGDLSKYCPSGGVGGGTMSREPYNYISFAG